MGWKRLDVVIVFGLKHALQGLKNLLSSERNFKIQLFLFLVALLAGLYLGISRLEWILILLVSALILALEAMNSSIERLCDLYTTEENKDVKWIKDGMAGGVLLASLIALIIGALIFIPKIYSLFFV
jgi:diacylglycerol kinase